MNYLVSLNNFEKLILSYLSRELEKYMALPFRVEATSYPISNKLLNINRNQYSAIPILKELSDTRIHPESYTLGITDLDLYVSNMNFTFGVFNHATKTAVLSIFRLRDEIYTGKKNNQKTLERIVKQAEYFFGRIFGLSECYTPRCIMNPFNTIMDIDYKSNGFCTTCILKMKNKGIIN